MSTTPKKALYRHFLTIIDAYKEEAYGHAAQLSKTQRGLDSKVKSIEAKGDEMLEAAKVLLKGVIDKPV